MTYFVVVCATIFLGVLLYLDVVKHFIDKEYWEGLKVVPVLMAANVFLGIYYNQSIWYKLSGNTKRGAYLVALARPSPSGYLTFCGYLCLGMLVRLGPLWFAMPL